MKLVAELRAEGRAILFDAAVEARITVKALPRSPRQPTPEGGAGVAVVSAGKLGQTGARVAGAEATVALLLRRVTPTESATATATAASVLARLLGAVPRSAATAAASTTATATAGASAATPQRWIVTAPHLTRPSLRRPTLRRPLLGL